MQSGSLLNVNSRSLCLAPLKSPSDLVSHIDHKRNVDLCKHMDRENRPYYNMSSHHDRARFRTEAFAQVRELAWSSVGQAGQLIEQYTAEVEQAIQALRTQLQQIVANLNEVKTELTWQVQVSLEEVEQTLPEDWPQFNSKYGAAFRQLLESPQPIDLFVFSSQPFALPTLTTRILSPAEIARDKFVAVYNNGVEVLHLRTQQVTQHALPVNFSVGGSFLELDRNTLLCVGARPSSAAVYALNLLTFQLNPLPRLSVPRNALDSPKLSATSTPLEGTTLPTT